MDNDYVASKKINGKLVTLGAYKMGKYGREIAISPAGWEAIAEGLADRSKWANFYVKAFPSKPSGSDPRNDGNQYTDYSKAKQQPDDDYSNQQIPF